MKKALLLVEKDNVAVVLDDVLKGETIEISGFGVKCILNSLDNIGLAHKVAFKDISKGNSVIKYGEVIGIAKASIKVGSHVHIHNIQSTRIGGN
ncbi:MAG: hypothetical protein JM58_13105 [Peptococcaceae bacterium BICA1-8]|nr:MAG: hypothetical protein JM58_13105 [Peptococcaceae bacterium BICA1-8]